MPDTGESEHERTLNAQIAQRKATLPASVRERINQEQT